MYSSGPKPISTFGCVCLGVAWFSNIFQQQIGMIEIHFHRKPPTGCVFGRGCRVNSWDSGTQDVPVVQVRQGAKQSFGSNDRDFEARAHSKDLGKSAGVSTRICEFPVNCLLF